MLKIADVEEAKALMTEGLNWSVMRWLREKKRVRKAADKANDALWAMQKAVKQSWSEELLSAYNELVARDDHAARTRGQQKAKDGASTIDPAIKRFAKAVKEADDEAWAAHLDAEETFDRADRTLSTSKAREGARKAILSWDLYEKAIVKAESGVLLTKAAK